MLGSDPEADEEMPVDWDPAGLPFEIHSTVPLHKLLQVLVKIPAPRINEIKALHPDFEIRKIGLYCKDGGTWEYAGGEAQNRQVASSIFESGRYRLFYNPEHELLPDKMTLNQTIRTRLIRPQ